MLAIQAQGGVDRQAAADKAAMARVDAEGQWGVKEAEVRNAGRGREQVSQFIQGKDGNPDTIFNPADGTYMRLTDVTPDAMPTLSAKDALDAALTYDGLAADYRKANQQEQADRYQAFANAYRHKANSAGRRDGGGKEDAELDPQAVIAMVQSGRMTKDQAREYGRQRGWN